MFHSVRQRRADDDSSEINIAPLIDIVFILLIFFLVNTTFIRETGIQVEKPAADTAAALPGESMRVAIAPSGAVYTEGRSVSPPELRSRVSAFVAEGRNRAVIVIPDRAVPSGRLVDVMDAARAAGAQNVSLATRREAP